ncbi:hypothetical protein MSNKSG1_14062 [Marinobacter santoriniensis NKSG1]|uniref:Amino acid transport protein n=1 Tax=Marinobacter santoriniensis NKSG1 TaxID=1288826 RepID=M7DB18_9GAMM|nr:hypothetical protein [Marinobacter santoriniensis]EMP54862.1 hypothetical protein MSNKSG1_14062 [Marinobacter santoriniensis NKSG1]
MGLQSEAQLIWGIVFGAIGFGFALYGKRQKSIVPLAAGIGLMGIPYIIANVYALVVAGVVLMAVPYFIRL